MSRYLGNPFETGILVALLVAGIATPWAAGVAALFFAGCEIAAGLRHRGGARWVPAAWPISSDPLTVVYDGTCALCVGSMNRLKRWQTADSIRFVAIQSSEAGSLLPGVPERELLGAMHVIDGSGVTTGADGWFRIMRLAPLRVAWIAWVTPAWVARPAYRLIARHRYRWFGRVCEGGSCSVHGDRPGGS